MLGLLPYLYLPVRAAMNFTKWTISVDPTLVRYDPSTFRGFLDLITGGDFKGAMFVFGLAELPARVTYYLGYLLEQFHPGFLAIALAGLLCLLVEDRAAAALLGFLYLGWLFYALEYDIADVYYYFIPTYLILAIWAAVGLAAVLRGVERLVSACPVRARVAAAALVSAGIVLTPFVGADDTYAAVDRSEDYKGRRAVEAVANGTEPDATVIHHRSSLWYMNLVEERRTDVKLIASFDLTFDDRDIEIARTALKTGPLYILHPSANNARYMRGAGLDLMPVEGDILYEVVPRDEAGVRGSRG